MQARKRSRNANVGISKDFVETPSQRIDWNSAKFHADKLFKAAQKLVSYLNGEGGDSEAAESAFIHADRVRQSLSSYLAVQKARYEIRRKMQS